MSLNEQANIEMNNIIEKTNNILLALDMIKLRVNQQKIPLTEDEVKSLHDLNVRLAECFESKE